MGTLHAFLHPEIPENKEIVISDRFKDEKGEVVPFTIRPVTEAESSAIRKKCTKTFKDRLGNVTKEFDAARYSTLFIIAGTVVPDFQATDLCEAYGVLDPEQVVGKMLLAGEASKLSDALTDLSGLEDSTSLSAEAKN